MEILQINTVNRIMSTGRNCYEISQNLNKNDIRNIILYSYGEQGDEGIKISSLIECKFHAFMSRLMGKQGYYSFFSTKNIIREIEQCKDPVVHLNNMHSNFVNIIQLLEYLGKHDIPTVITLHDCWFYTGRCMHYTSDGCYKWKTGCGNCHRLKKDNPSWFFDRSAEMWNDKLEAFTKIPRLGVIGVSNWITNEARCSPMFKNAKCITRIYNWIDLDIFKPKNNVEFRNKYNLDDKIIILGVASGWGISKGLDKFLELSTLLDDKEVIVLVGAMPKITLPKNIIHIDQTNDVSELVDIYNSADMFLQLSQEETFGKVVAEALACGTPVITNNKTANPELVNKDCGIVVSSLGNKELYAAVKEIESKERKCYSEYCRKYAEEHFDKDKNIGEYLEMYLKLSEEQY